MFPRAPGFVPVALAGHLVAGTSRALSPAFAAGTAVTAAVTTLGTHGASGAA